MWCFRFGRFALLWAGIAACSVGVPAAVAQVPPPPSPEATEIAACLCLEQAVQILGAEMTARQGAYEASRAEVARLDEQLQGARAGLDVNDPQAVARFRQLLEQRDTAFGRSSGAAFGEFNTAVERYNFRVNEFNARCANRPRNPVLLNQVRATLICPPPY